MSRAVRGPYKRYLVDDEVPVPEATIRSRQRRMEIDGEEIQIQPNDETDKQGSLKNDDDVASLHERLEGEFPQSTSDVVSMGETYETVETRQEQDEDGCDSMCDDSSISELNTYEGLNSEHLYEDAEDNFVVREDSGENYESDSSGGFESEDNVADEGGFCSENESRSFSNEGNMLYSGCGISKEESELLILSFALRFGLSDLALGHLIKLIDCHLPSQQHGSLFMLMKKFPLPPKVVTRYLCPEGHCQRLLKDIENGEMICDCGLKCSVEDLKDRGSYFLQIPLKDQLKRLLENNDLRAKFTKGGNELSDVPSGRVYKKLMDKGVISEVDITLQWNTDGVQIFKSSKMTIWPIQVAVNELPFRERRENIMLCGLWYGQGKPNMNSFLSCFVEELNSLHTEGIGCQFSPNGQPTVVKVHPLIASVDSQARPALQNLKTYRGIHGCSFCLHKGEEVQVGRGAARVYRGDVGQLRTKKQHLKDVMVVERSGVVVNGIKGPSVLLLLNVFDIITSFVPDYMHCVLLGVVKTIVEWWLEGSHKNEVYYLGSPQKISEFDAIALAIKPPSELTRTPRSLKDRMLWKASEWKNFLLYYSLPCLASVRMPGKYIDHWFLLVYSMHIFLQEKITEEEFSKAEAALRKFVLTLEEVYNSPQIMKYNIHLLLHIPKSVRDFGALWGVSTFSFEHQNGILAQLFHNANSVPQQICNSYLRLLAVKERASKVFTKNSAPGHAKTLYKKMIIGGKRSGLCSYEGDHLRLFGAPKYVNLTEKELAAIESLVKEEVKTKYIVSHKRFIYKKVLYNVQGYERMSKRANNIVELLDRSLISLTNALKIKTVSNEQALCVLLGLRLHPTYDIICKDRSLKISSRDIIKVVHRTSECTAIFPGMLRRKCVAIHHKLTSYVSTIVNNVERD